jgi:hypothetical protein
MIKLFVLFMWFIIITFPNLDAIEVRYFWKEDCTFYQRVFARLHSLKVTECTEIHRKDEEEIG